VSAPATETRPGTLHEALLAVQAAVGELGLSRDGRGSVEGVGKRGGSYRFDYQYLTYAKLLDALRPVLTENGLIWQTFPTTLEGKPALYYAMTFAPDGSKVDGTMLLMMDKQTSQAQGSAITYARRYALMAVCEITPDEDDDGAAASQPARPAPVDPEALLPEGVLNAMSEAIAERGLSRERVLERAGWTAGAPVTQEHGRKVKAILDAHDAGGGS
jgi:hypothetical protein